MRRSEKKPSAQEEKVKSLLIEAGQRKRAAKEINFFLKNFKGKSLIQLLPVLLRRSNRTTVLVALERIERNQKKELSHEDHVFLKEIRDQLEESDDSSKMPV